MQTINGIMQILLSALWKDKKMWMRIEGDQIFIDGKCLEGVQVTPDMRELATNLHKDLALCGEDKDRAEGLRLKFANDLREMMPESKGKEDFILKFLESGLF